MIPVPSTTPVYGPWLYRMRSRKVPLIDYERGGVALDDPSQGLDGYDWTVKYDPADSGIYVWREDQGEASKVLLLTKPGVTRICLAFDQNMRAHVAWEDASGVTLRRYNGTAMEEMPIPNASSPCLTLDIHQLEFVTNSDILLGYNNGTNLCVRVQREVYAVEHVQGDVGNAPLMMMGANTSFRMQWRMRPMA